MTIDDFFGVGSREVTQPTAYGLALDRSTGFAVVQNLVSAMTDFLPAAYGQMDLDLSVRNDANVGAAFAVWA